MNNIDEELDGLSLTGSVIIAIMEWKNFLPTPEILGWNIISLGPDWPKVIA